MLNNKDLTLIKDAIKAHNAKTVALQVPEGLKTSVREMAAQIEALDSKPEVLIFADPCFGACDIPDLEMKRYGCDLIVHLGHSLMVKNLALPTVYIEYYSDIDIIPLLKKELKKLDKYRKITLATTIQHTKKLPEVREFLEKSGKTVYIGTPKVARYPGQVLGCDPSAALDPKTKDSECILFFGTGRFHVLGIAKHTDKPVYLLSIEDKTLYDMKDEQYKFERKRIILRHKFDEAKTICIVGTTKVGQMRKNIIDIKKDIEKKGKKAFIVIMDFIDEKSLLGMQYDMIINTACPRIDEDLVFSKPVMNYTDIPE